MPPYDEYSSLWEGNSPNAVRAYKRMEAAGQAPDNSWLERLFSRRQPAPYTPAPTDEGRFPAEAPSPFTAPPPPAKPVSKLSSAADLGTRIRQIVQQPWQGEGDTATFDPIRRLQQAWQGEGDTAAPAPPDVDAILRAFTQANPEPPESAPRVPINMRDEPQASPFTAASLAGLPASVKRAVSELLGGGNQFGGQKFGGAEYGGNQFGGNQFGGNRFGGNRFGASAGPGETGGQPMMEPAPLPYGGSTYGGNTFGGARFGGEKFGGRRFGASADPVVESPPARTGAQMWRELQKKWASPFEAGGEVPGYMRGGFPELLTTPVRHRFESGGQSYVEGDGDGRADDVDARLSSGEFVIDGETVSMLGNGNSKAGAKKLDEFRQNIRKHKGAALAKGKFSPNAKKNPAEYLVRDSISDGIRRLGKK